MADKEILGTANQEEPSSREPSLSGEMSGEELLDDRELQVIPNAASESSGSSIFGHSDEITRPQPPACGSLPSRLSELKRQHFDPEGKAERVARALAALYQEQTIGLSPAEWDFVAMDPDLDD
jgi:hypothetical protein